METSVSSDSNNSMWVHGAQYVWNAIPRALNFWENRSEIKFLKHILCFLDARNFIVMPLFVWEMYVSTRFFMTHRDNNFMLENVAIPLKSFQWFLMLWSHCQDNSAHLLSHASCHFDITSTSGRGCQPSLLSPSISSLSCLPWCRSLFTMVSAPCAFPLLPWVHWSDVNVLSKIGIDTHTHVAVLLTLFRLCTYLPCLYVCFTCFRELARLFDVLLP